MSPSDRLGQSFLKCVFRTRHVTCLMSPKCDELADIAIKTRCSMNGKRIGTYLDRY